MGSGMAAKVKDDVMNHPQKIIEYPGTQQRQARSVTDFDMSDEDRRLIWTRAFDMWLDQLQAENTRKAYARAWEDFAGSSSKADEPWRVGKYDIAVWKKELEDRGLSDATIQQRLAAVSSFYRYVGSEFTVMNNGREMPLHDVNPALGVKRPKVDAYDKATFLGVKEVRRLLQVLRPDSVQKLRDRALFLFYVYTGRRNSEVRTLRWGDFTMEGHRMMYKWRGKGKSRKDELPPPVWSVLCEYLRQAGRLDRTQGIEPEEDEFVFTALSDRATRLPTVDEEEWERYAQPLSSRTVGKLLKKYARQAGLDAEKVHVHTLRHTAAYLRREAGDDVEAVSRLLNHSSIAVTQIYLHSVEGKKDQSWNKVEELLGG